MGAQVRTIRAEPTTAFAVSADGVLALTGGADGVVRLWHLDRELEDGPSVTLPVPTQHVGRS
ncbi:hypothetical protein [Kitasatospora sp. NPDC001683]